MSYLSTKCYFLFNIDFMVFKIVYTNDCFFNELFNFFIEYRKDNVKCLKKYYWIK